jgi:hypothetical protein
MRVLTVVEREHNAITIEEANKSICGMGFIRQRDFVNAMS